METSFESGSQAAYDFDDEIEVPPSYKVIFLNDDYTTMEFVVDVLMSVFRKTQAQAEAIMKEVHVNGKGVAGIYSYDIAATRCKLTMQRARAEGFPLKCILEKV